MAGIALAQAIEENSKINTNLKWPNDILIDEQKCGGILCESFKRDTTETCVVIGFGINVGLSESEFPKDLKKTATSLQTHTKQPLDRHQLLGCIIPALEQGWEKLKTQSPETYQHSYSRRCSTLGKHISVQFPDGSTLTGKADSINRYGQLQIALPPSEGTGESDRMVKVHAGDVHHIR